MSSSIARLRATSVYTLRATMPREKGEAVLALVMRKAQEDSDHILSGLAVTSSTYESGDMLLSYRVSGHEPGAADADATAIAEWLVGVLPVRATLTTGVGVNRRVVAQQV